MVVDGARCRCEVQQARLSLHVPLLVTTVEVCHRAAHVQGTYQKHMLSALGAPQWQVPAVWVVHAVHQDGMIKQGIL